MLIEERKTMVNTIFFYTIGIRICLKNNLSVIVEFGGEGEGGGH